jgi:hypothetical protein
VGSGLSIRYHARSWTRYRRLSRYAAAADTKVRDTRNFRALLNFPDLRDVRDVRGGELKLQRSKRRRIKKEKAEAFSKKELVLDFR